ncbi:MAG: SagB family peptide dehydrogenase [Vicinamibacterales bacterium]
MTYWSNSGFVYFDCQTQTRRTAPASVVPLLDAMENWHTPESFAKLHPEIGAERQVASLFESLAGLGLAEREGDRGEKYAWSDWLPEAAFFHFATRDSVYPLDILEYELPLVEKAKTIPQPVPTKTSAGPRSPLPAARDMGELGLALKSRRTWRQFRQAPIDLASLATLMGLTWGIQRCGVVRGQGKVVFRTSPSGGSRHPGEAYVIAHRVTGLAPAVYHYDSATHELVKVGPRLPRDRFVRILANQHYFRDCAAAIVMTACFERPMWRYPFTRAYRSVLIEAGHLAQTFALLATTMQLAPFQTIAFRDSELERVIGVDGVKESAMYVLGVGQQTRPVVDHPGRMLPRRS